MSKKFILFFLSTFSAVALAATPQQASCDKNFSELKANYTLTSNNLDKFSKDMSQFKGVNPETVKAVRSGAANEANSLNTLYPVIQKYKDRGEYEKCSQLASETNKGILLVNNLLKNSVEEVKKSEADYPRAKKESACSSDKECAVYYDAVSQVFIGKALENYKTQINLVLARITQITKN